MESWGPAMPCVGLGRHEKTEGAIFLYSDGGRRDLGAMVVGLASAETLAASVTTPNKSPKANSSCGNPFLLNQEMCWGMFLPILTTNIVNSLYPT